MEELAALGGLILGNAGGAVAAPVVHQPVYNHDSPAPPVYSHAEQSATDALFTTQSEEQPPLPVAAMVVSAAVVNLKAIVIDESRKESDEDDEEEERPAGPRLGERFEE